MTIFIEKTDLPRPSLLLYVLSAIWRCDSSSVDVMDRSELAFVRKRFWFYTSYSMKRNVTIDLVKKLSKVWGTLKLIVENKRCIQSFFVSTSGCWIASNCYSSWRLMFGWKKYIDYWLDCTLWYYDYQYAKNNMSMYNMDKQICANVDAFKLNLALYNKAIFETIMKPITNEIKQSMTI